MLQKPTTQPYLCILLLWMLTVFLWCYLNLKINIKQHAMARLTTIITSSPTNCQPLDSTRPLWQAVGCHVSSDLPVRKSDITITPQGHTVHLILKWRWHHSDWTYYCRWQNSGRWSVLTWCEDNNHTRNTHKTKDMRKERGAHQQLIITDLMWRGWAASNSLWWHSTRPSWSRKHKHFLRRLKKSGMSPEIFCNFCSCTVENILTSCITMWRESIAAMDRRCLQRVVKTAEMTTTLSAGHLPPEPMVKDSTHLLHRLFTRLSSGRRYRSVKCRTSRLRDSFSPTGIRLSLRPPQHTSVSVAHDNKCFELKLNWIF